MVLGTLTLFNKRGIFYTEEQFSPTDSYTEVVGQQLGTGPSVTVPDLPDTYPISPVEEQGDTDYINATFEDKATKGYPYQVTVWVLVEEIPETYTKKQQKS